MLLDIVICNAIDDLLEGRYPGLRGGELAAKYIATVFATYGLKPAGDNGTYFQNINFVGMKAIADQTSMSLVPASGNPIPLKSTNAGGQITIAAEDLKTLLPVFER